MNFKIFLVYRRHDTGTVTGRTFDRLAAAFGDDKIFRDIDSIPPGCDFRLFLEEAIKGCQLMIVMMGADWMGVDRETGRRRIDLPLDYLHIELELALRHRLSIVPVLVDGTKMPKKHELPPELSDFAEQEPLALNHQTFALDYPLLEKIVQEKVNVIIDNHSSLRISSLQKASDGSKYFFISYAREDFDFARRLTSSLQNERISVWMDVLHMKIGMAWEDQVEDALKNAAAVIFVMSEKSLASDTVKDEISFAIDRKKPIIPVRIDEC